MATLGAFVRSKVARRIVVLFVLCSLLPVVGLAVVAFNQVSRQLRAAGRQRLHQTSKSVAMDLVERLRRLDAEMTLVESAMLAPDPGAHNAGPDRFSTRLAQGFTSLAVVSGEGASRVLLGSLPSAPDLTPSEIAHMRTGKCVLTMDPGPGGTPRLFMRRLLSWGHDRVLVAHIDDSFLWNRDTVPPSAELHVLGPSLEPLFTSFADGHTLRPDVLRRMSGSTTGELEWEHDGETYIGDYFSVPLRFDFLTSQWTIVVSEARSTVLAPINSAGTTFLLVTLLSLWVVMLLSLSQVRRSLVPLTRLQEGTRRIGRGDFDKDVDVTSGDEFEELADSFNTMSRRLKRQFNALSAMGELDRAVLSSLNVETIVGTVLDRLPQLLDCDHVAVILLGPDPGDRVRAFVKASRDRTPAEVAPPSVTREDARSLLENRDVIRLRRQHGVPGYLSPLDETGWATCVALPIAAGNRLAGILVLAHAEATDWSEEDLSQARQLADQVAVAVSNAHLVQALDRLNVGTLNALARTVDAKSPWTAGHSQRVTAMAVEIGRMMGLAPDDLDTIARGGLLHDIGKIAVPSAILNKPSRLTAEEFMIMKEHPRTGARILEPIPEYGRLIPIVVQHHEWFDGRGYPDGIAGETISVEARVVAVADVFDALTSLRPYRPAMTFDRATSIIRSGSGQQFDPRMVEAFLAVLERNDAVYEHQAHVIRSPRNHPLGREEPYPGRAVSMLG